MSHLKRITRRQFFAAGGGIAACAVLAACGGAAPAAPPAAPKPTEAPKAAAPTEAPKAAAPAASKFKESPMLAELVKAGKLPPVDQRLPKEPFVVGPGELVGEKYLQPKIGKYGGTMRLAQEGPGGDPHIFIGSNEGVLWAPAAFDYAKGIKGNVVRSWEVNAEGSVYTFKMREGLKWSDGQPVTTADVKFAYEDVLLNDKITPIFPNYLRVGMSAAGAPGVIKVADDFTFSISFEKPYGSFPAQIAIAGWRGYGGIIKPAHYLKQFHINSTFR